MSRLHQTANPCLDAKRRGAPFVSDTLTNNAGGVSSTRTCFVLCEVEAGRPEQQFLSCFVPCHSLGPDQQHLGFLRPQDTVLDASTPQTVNISAHRCPSKCAFNHAGCSHSSIHWEPAWNRPRYSWLVGNGRMDPVVILV